jgi:hypothetical protein
MFGISIRIFSFSLGVSYKLCSSGSSTRKNSQGLRSGKHAGQKPLLTIMSTNTLDKACTNINTMWTVAEFCWKQPHGLETTAWEWHLNMSQPSLDGQGLRDYFPYLSETNASSEKIVICRWTSPLTTLCWNQLQIQTPLAGLWVEYCCLTGSKFKQFCCPVCTRLDTPVSRARHYSDYLGASASLEPLG